MNDFDSLAATIDSAGSAHFADSLLTWLHSYADFDSAVVLAYPNRGSLQVLHDALHPQDHAGFYGPYAQGLFVLSPLYQQATEGRRGFFHLPDIAPADFRESEFYELYYVGSGVHDHCGFLLEAGDGSPLVISLERTSALSPYTEAEKSRLTDIAPVAAALVRRHWVTPGAADSATNTTDLQTQVDKLLAQFGSSVLTPREREVVQWVLRGHPSKTVARNLGISAHTEQVHRKNIYQKLQLSSHNELFSLFFELLRMPFDGEGDPLEALEIHKGK